MRNIPFNIPPATGREPEYLAKAIANHKVWGRPLYQAVPSVAGGADGGAQGAADHLRNQCAGDGGAAVQCSAGG